MFRRAEERMMKRNPNHLSARPDGAWDTHRRHGNESKNLLL